MMIVECFSRWPEAVPVENIEASTVARAFYTTWTARFGNYYRSQLIRVAVRVYTFQRSQQHDTSLFGHFAHHSIGNQSGLERGLECIIVYMVYGQLLQLPGEFQSVGGMTVLGDEGTRALLECKGKAKLDYLEKTGHPGRSTTMISTCRNLRVTRSFPPEKGTSHVVLGANSSDCRELQRSLVRIGDDCCGLRRITEDDCREDLDEPVLEVRAGAEETGNVSTGVLATSVKNIDGSIDDFVGVTSKEVVGTVSSVDDRAVLVEVYDSSDVGVTVEKS
ncbi:hypothetical protein PR048_005162 [Dryococelus australis]|uniref:Uncharacterized protein n=1 Tax=Dryococelus australis TaxID=614101 RepID=A0ABQ9I8B3_9NEOP|nr:hypothetical protein PR048_005162 [Dryococelus australis]